MKNKTIMVALSGGIDSSVSAYLLQQEGFKIQGVYMKLHNVVPNYHENNIASIEKVADFLGIKYDILDLEDKFKDDVYDYFVKSYQDGITPNPCVICNKTIKFGAMYDFAMQKGCDFLATGHYVQTDGTYIYQAFDKSKDQSYFLGQIDKHIIPKLMFPMSKYTKEHIRQIASNIPALADLSKKKDSQEICFVENNYTDILKLHTNIDQKGEVLDELGEVVGHHKGYMHYTIGKRKGFYVHGAHDPHFVKHINSKTNTITVCKKDSLAITQVTISNINSFVDLDNLKCQVKLRYRSKTTNCTVVLSPNNTATIELDTTVYGVANGQIAVFYDGDKLLGSGIIINTTFCE